MSVLFDNVLCKQDYCWSSKRVFISVMHGNTSDVKINNKLFNSQRLKALQYNTGSDMISF